MAVIMQRVANGVAVPVFLPETLHRYRVEDKAKAEQEAKENNLLLCMEYEAWSDCDSVFACAPEKYQELKKAHENPYSGWVTILKDYTGGKR